MADTDTDPTVEAPAADTLAPGTDPDPFDDGANSFDRKYVEKLRQENARYRTDSKQARDELGRYTTAFDGLDDATRDSLLAIPTYLKDPARHGELATWLRSQADGLTPAEQAEVKAELGEAADDKGAKLSPAEVQKIIDDKLAERDQQAAIDREGENIRKQVEGFGVEWQSKKATAILAIAASHYNGDIAKAYYETMAAWAQESVDQYVGGRQQDATGPRPVPDAGQAAGAAPQTPLTWKDADRAANSYIAARRGTPGR